METIYAPGVLSWFEFFIVFLVLALIYFSLFLISKRLERGVTIREFGTFDRSLADTIFLVYAPLAIFILVATFVAVWPAVHGLVVLFIVIPGFPYIQNYLSGRILRLDRNVQRGQQLNFGKITGTISAFGPTSIYVQSEAGSTRIPYRSLLSKNYTVVSDPTQGGYFRLHVDAREDSFSDGTPDKIIDQLRYLLLDNPYVMPGFKIDRTPSDLDEVSVDLQVRVHKYDHLRHLMAQLNETGFSSTLKQT